MAVFTKDELRSLRQDYQPNYSQFNPKPAPAHKAPGGLAGFLVNNLPAITSGVGAVGGSFIAPFAGTAAGGAAGGALGEYLKRKILGQNEDIGQIATQGLEGGVLSAAGGAFRGIKSGAQALTRLGKPAVEEAANVAEKTAGKSGFMKNLVTQGQAAQGRTAGISGGTKVAGKELVPQDTERMLETLNREGIQTGNGNNTLRDITDRLKGYGKQIGDHFKTENAPLHAADTKVIAENFLKDIPTTDSRVLDEAKILADDLQKNVKDTKSLWEFRKSLDSRIPDAKLAAGDNVLSNRLTAVKSMRQYISNELGDIPGMKGYHDLAEIKPFVSKEANRQNNVGGSIFNRVLSSGPAQKLENAGGKVIEKVGKSGAKEAPQAVDTMAPANQNFMQKLVGAAANPVANPGQTAGAVLKQEAGRGFGIPAAVTNEAQNQQQQSGEDINTADTLLQASAASPQDSSNPFDPSNVEANVAAILRQGGKQSDVSSYLANVKAYQALTTPSGSSLNATQQQQANNANSALSDLQSLSDMIAQDPSIVTKSGIPLAGSNSLVQRATGTTDYEAAKNNIVDVISRLRSGAAISASEERLYKSLLPSAGDTAESANSKLQRLATLFGSFSNPQGTSGSDVTDLLANAGVQ